jgi:hypothetical protein
MIKHMLFVSMLVPTASILHGAAKPVDASAPAAAAAVSITLADRTRPAPLILTQDVSNSTVLVLPPSSNSSTTDAIAFLASDATRTGHPDAPRARSHSAAAADESDSAAVSQPGSPVGETSPAFLTPSHSRSQTPVANAAAAASIPSPTPVASPLVLPAATASAAPASHVTHIADHVLVSPATAALPLLLTAPRTPQLTDPSAETPASLHSVDLTPSATASTTVRPGNQAATASALSTPAAAPSELTTILEAAGPGVQPRTSLTGPIPCLAADAQNPLATPAATPSASSAATAALASASPAPSAAAQPTPAAAVAPTPAASTPPAATPQPTPTPARISSHNPHLAGCSAALSVSEAAKKLAAQQAPSNKIKNLDTLPYVLGDFLKFCGLLSTAFHGWHAFKQHQLRSPALRNNNALIALASAAAAVAAPRLINKLFGPAKTEQKK